MQTLRASIATASRISASSALTDILTAYLHGWKKSETARCDFRSLTTATAIVVAFINLIQSNTGSLVPRWWKLSAFCVGKIQGRHFEHADG
jgi:hypothetical protein